MPSDFWNRKGQTATNPRTSKRDMSVSAQEQHLLLPGPVSLEAVPQGCPWGTLFGNTPGSGNIFLYFLAALLQHFGCKKAVFWGKNRYVPVE